MQPSPLAGQPSPREMLVNVSRLVSAYYTGQPDNSQPGQRVTFGTSGHRGSSLENSFNETHIIAISQAICDYRQSAGISGPLFIGIDTHALSEPALASALEVFAANGVEVRLQTGLGYTPTPVISHAILTYNQSSPPGLRADGVVITPSHNPPEDGGFKYNPPEGGPADTETTAAIQNRANAIIQNELRTVNRIPLARARSAATTHEVDLMTPYLEDLSGVIDLEVVAAAGISIGVDPMGGAAVEYWGPLADRYNLNLKVVNPVVDPTFSFMTVDTDGKIRMDCSSPDAMARLVEMKDDFDIAFGNDPDADRHGIVTRSTGLMNPNQFLAVAIWYLFQHRPGWSKRAAVGKTMVSSSMIDRIAGQLGRQLVEVPVGFKWFVPGLLDGSLGFGGEESAGASFLRRSGSVWTTDKDGIIAGLLAAEILAVTGKDPGEQYRSLEDELGQSFYARIDVPASRAQKEVLKALSPEQVDAQSLGGNKITAHLTRAPGNNEALGGLKVVTANGWFAARPSGTEDVYKIYAESFISAEHLRQIQEEAQAVIHRTFQAAGAG